MKNILAMLYCALISAAAWAQTGGADAKVDINVNKDGPGSIPWLWIVGGVLVVVLLVALIGRGGEKTTVIKE